MRFWRRFRAADSHNSWINFWGALHGENHQLVLETEFPWGTKSQGERTNIIFDGVWCHHLESIQDGNIIFDIEQVELAQIEKEFRSVFERLKNYGWPRLEEKDDTFSRVVERRHLKVYRIGSSYGMEGFVVAESVQQTNSEQADAANRHPFGTSGLLPADSATRAGSRPEASGDS